MEIALQSNFQRDLSRLSISLSGECLWFSAILSFFSYCWFACGSPCKTAQTLPRIPSRISQGILPLAVRWAGASWREWERRIELGDGAVLDSDGLFSFL